MSANEAELAGKAAPEEVLIVLPVRNMVLFPQLVQPLSIKRERCVAAAQEAVKSGRKVGLLLQKETQGKEEVDGDHHGLLPQGSSETIVPTKVRLTVFVSPKPGNRVPVLADRARPRTSRSRLRRKSA